MQKSLQLPSWGLPGTAAAQEQKRGAHMPGPEILTIRKDSVPRGSLAKSNLPSFDLTVHSHSFQKQFWCHPASVAREEH